ncbi:MAG: hypothetical protein GY938_17210 [Ketobacter sp.]|nr:hypothetical protein [Ketobacter sp.]
MAYNSDRLSVNPVRYPAWGLLLKFSHEGLVFTEGFSTLLSGTGYEWKGSKQCCWKRLLIDIEILG